MRRLPLLIAVGALWLFLAALPALADGGPHVAALNNGSGGLTADSCAGCHRAHTAQNDFLLKQASTTDLCLSCHGTGGTGATTNVLQGVQFVPSATNPQNRTGVVLGALRDGGFVTAPIGTSNAYKLIVALPYNTVAKIPVRVDANGNMGGGTVTSAHLAVSGNSIVATGKTWGNFTTDGSPTGATGGTLECTSCHNPHGNDAYRILQTQPVVNGGDFAQVTAANAVKVTDAALPPAGDTRNYTIIQQQTGGTNTTLLASQVQALEAAGMPNTAGDFFRKSVPWNASGAASTPDQPNGDSAFISQINAWCATCHSRYLSAGADDTTNTNAVFHNRHYALGNQAVGSIPAGAHTYPVCTTCHVAHGSNAQMTVDGNSATVPYPDGSVVNGDSRLLKADNRGICQTCHDPTHTLVNGDSVGPTPSPYLP